MRKETLQKGFIKNYILIGDKNHQLENAMKLVEKIEKESPHLFEGKRACFPFELRYVEPYDKNFRELKRLQAKAAEAAGFHDEYRGYIILDLSSYLRHEEEAYFEITMKFLHDMNENWRYIFLLSSDGKNKRVIRALICQMMTILGDRPFEIQEEKMDKQTDCRKEILRICQEYEVECLPPVVNCFQKLMVEKGITLPVISAILRGVMEFYDFDHKIGMSMVRRYLREGNPMIAYMLSEKAYKELLNEILQKGNEEHLNAILQKENEDLIYGKAV